MVSGGMDASAPVAAIVYIWNDFIHTGNALGL